MAYLNENKLLAFTFFTSKVCQQQQKKEQYIALRERTKAHAKFRRNHKFKSLCCISPESHLTESSQTYVELFPAS